MHPVALFGLLLHRKRLANHGADRPSSGADHRYHSTYEPHQIDHREFQQSQISILVRFRDTAQFRLALYSAAFQRSIAVELIHTSNHTVFLNGNGENVIASLFTFGV
jgi:predicted component of viral defense system (DUF524 family)